MDNGNNRTTHVGCYNHPGKTMLVWS